MFNIRKFINTPIITSLASSSRCTSSKFATANYSTLFVTNSTRLNRNYIILNKELQSFNNITTINNNINTTRFYSTESEKPRNDNENKQNEQKQEEQKQNNQQQQQQQQQQRRDSRNYSEELREKNKSVGLWVLTGIIAVLGASYAAVPLYRVFCRVTGYGGTVRESDDLATDTKNRNLNRDVYPIKVTFTSSVGNKIPWTFKPTQQSIECLPGEPVLAFYRATNNTDAPIIGVATYNITPMKAGPYFTKIQCFCFDEQRIKSNETIDMPVLFVIEPDILDDKSLQGVADITLSYTFFKSNDQGELEEI